MPLAVVRIGRTVVAESSVYESVEGDIYFPAMTVNLEFLEEGDHALGGRIGERRFYSVKKGNLEATDCAWLLIDPPARYERLKGYIGFREEAPLMLQLKKIPLKYVSPTVPSIIETISEEDEEE